MMPNQMGRDSKSPCAFCGKYAKWQCDFLGDHEGHFEECKRLICTEHAIPEFEEDTEAFLRGDNLNFFTLCPVHKDYQIRITYA